MRSKRILVHVLTPLLLQVVSPVCEASTISVPRQQPTIQAAIDSARTGDVVLVSPGTYFENIDFKGKAIIVIAVHAARPAIIDGGWKGPVVVFHEGEGPRSMLVGFTIRHGAGYFGTPPCYYSGGGVCVVRASPSILRNTITDNVALEGSGIAVQFGAPLIAQNDIRNNTEDGSGGIGGGISLLGTRRVRIVDNVIENNRMDFGGGIGMFAAGTPVITGNIFRGNQAAEGGGVWIVNATDAFIGQNLFTGNSAGSGAGVYWTVPYGDRGPLLVSNTIANNYGQAIYAGGFDRNTPVFDNLIVASSGQEALYCDPYDHYPPALHNNDVFSAGGLAYGGYCTDQTHVEGNLSADPLFVSAASGDYHLQALSPAIDAGINSAPRLAAADFDGVIRILDGDLDGTSTVDMGIYEYKPSQAAGSITSVVPPGSRASHAGMSHPSLRRFESVDKDNHRTVQYYDAAGRLVAEMDARGMYHRK